MIRVQTQENIHSEPFLQNTAHILAEAFFWLKKNGDGVPRYKFAASHNVSDKIMADVMHYVALPQRIRDYTDAGVLPYPVAVEIGRAAPYVRRYANYKQIPEEAAENYINDELSLMVMAYRKHGQVKAIRRIRNSVQDIKETMMPSSGVQEVFDLKIEERTLPEEARLRLEASLRESRLNHELQTAELHNAIVRYCGAIGLELDIAHYAQLELASQQLPNRALQVV